MNFGLELIDLRTLPPDDDAWPRGTDVNLQLVGRTLDFDLRHTRMGETLLELGA